ncbi:thiamine pyrophosphate-dependent enzyme [Rhodoblastus sp.]|uniref:thiamine pyrophosphate-dependent enzyme n=1 Tax=Rhodoblastus sp. TaxID=1962975 RepID=UPI003F9D7037
MTASSFMSASSLEPRDGELRLAGFLGDGDDLSVYRAMLLIRRFEEKAGQLFGMGLIGGFCHLYIGQEAIVVGMRLAARETDQFIASYRHHGHLLACGADPRGIMAEMAGRRGGLSGGKGGSMHMFAPQLDYFGGHGVVGAQASLGTGLAFANSYRDDGRVCVCFFGDGAADQGQVAESFNMAARWRLPIVYVIENNRSVPGHEGELARRGAAFDIPGEAIDGMDVEAAREAGTIAIERARAGHGPAILEMRVERYRGHSLADPAKYRRKDEPRVSPAPDPIERQRQRILESGQADEGLLKRLDAEVRALVTDAAEYAAQSPAPGAAELLTEVLR